MNDDSTLPLPLGAVTLTLADLAGSVRLWETEPDEMAKAIARHDEIISEAIESHEGVRPKDQGEGDSFLSAFSLPSEALRCALDIQLQFAREKWPTSVPLSLRMAIHTGEVQLRDERNYVGQAVNRCGRLRDAAHGGQILLSSSSYALLADRVPPNVDLRDLGSYSLPGLTRPEHVYQVCHPSLTEQFPPLRVDTVPTSTRAPNKKYRVVLADDNYLVREGTVALLASNPEVQIVGTAYDLPSLLEVVDTLRPDIVLTDIRMPPTDSDEGIVAAKRIRESNPETAVLVLSQYGEKRYAEELLRPGVEGVGYLLKDRLMDIGELIHAIREVARGGTVLDSRIVSTLVTDSEVESAYFYREGDFWTLGFSKRPFKLKDLRGLHHIHRLLQAPGREVHCLELSTELAPAPASASYGDASLSVEGATEEILDLQARTAYKQRLLDLEIDIQEAEEFGDLEKASSLREEMEKITLQLTAALGLGGRSRRAASMTEKARVSATRAIRAATKRMSAYDEKFADYMDSHIQTGTFSSYRKDPAAQLHWILFPEGREGPANNAET